MSRGRPCLFAAVALALGLALTGCRQAAGQPTAQTGAVSTSTPNPFAFVGAYRIEQADQVERIQNQVTIILNSDNSAVVTWVKLFEDTLTTAGSTGSWQVVAPDRVKVVLNETNDQPLEDPVVFELAFGDGFITRIIADEQSEQVTGYRFTLGSGDRHPAIRKLHEKLSRISWLNFKDPGPSGDVYGEETRKAVVDFQESQGMLATGIVDAATWAAMENPQPPGAALARALPATPIPTYAAPPGVVTPQPRETPTACSPSAVTDDAVRLRAGPGTEFGELDVMPGGSVLSVTGRNPGGDWLQVAFDGQPGWVFGELVTTQCMDGDLPVIDAPDAQPGQP